MIRLKRHEAAGLLVAVAVIALVATTAFGASPHFIGTPTCTTTSTSVTCTGSIAGLGNGDVKITISSSASATFLCTNKGGNTAAGVNKVPFTATASATIPSNEVKNGRVNFSLSAPQATPTATSQEAGCPNGNWTTTLNSITFGDVTITVEQPPGTIVLTTTVTPS
jgi:hypothetical protein